MEQLVTSGRRWALGLEHALARVIGSGGRFSNYKMKIRRYLVWYLVYEYSSILGTGTWYVYY